MRKILFLIPARGGSQGLFKKNIRSFCGSPLIEFTINEVLSSKYFSNSIVVCSSDDQEILKIVKSINPLIICHERPYELSTNNSTIQDLLLYLIKTGTIHPTGMDVCILQPTSPLRTSKDIDNSFDIFYSQNHNGLVSVTTLKHSNHPSKILIPNHENSDTLVSHSVFNPQPTQRQKILLTAYSRNGAIYIIRSENIKKGVLSNPTGYYQMPFSKSIDIDNEDDFRVAQSLMSSMQPERIR